MRNQAIPAALLALSLFTLAFSQSGYPRSRRGASPNKTLNAGAYGGPAVTFHGTLKQVTKREIVIQTTGEDQALSIGRSHKTKFFQGDREIKPSDIPAGAALTLDVTEDPDLKPIAVNVFVDATPAKSAGK